MAEFKKAPAPKSHDQTHTGLTQLDPAMVNTAIMAATIFWPTVVGIVVVLAFVIKRLRWLAFIAFFASSILQFITLQFVATPEFTENLPQIINVEPGKP